MPDASLRWVAHGNRVLLSYDLGTRPRIITLWRGSHVQTIPQIQPIFTGAACFWTNLECHSIFRTTLDFYILVVMPRECQNPDIKSGIHYFLSSTAPRSHTSQPMIISDWSSMLCHTENPKQMLLNSFTPILQYATLASCSLSFLHKNEAVCVPYTNYPPQARAPLRNVPCNNMDRTRDRKYQL